MEYAFHLFFIHNKSTNIMNLQRIKSVLAIGLVLTSASWLSAQVRTLGGLPAVPQHAAKQAKQKKAPKPASATKSG